MHNARDAHAIREYLKEYRDLWEQKTELTALQYQLAAIRYQRALRSKFPPNQPRGPWDYKRRSLTYENIGNFNYGATGAAVGFSEDVLFVHGGLDAGLSQPEYSA